MPRVVQCHGCFDLLHIGHIRHFEAAKQYGDTLIVTITADTYVNKGPGRPVFTADQRAEAVRALRCVDDVRIVAHPTASEAIREIRPHVFAKGCDYEPASIHPDERDAIAEVGAELVITQTEKWSSTALLKHLPNEASAYLDRIRSKYRWADVKAYLDKALDLKVLVIGDAIRDEYHYVDTLGKSGKDPILAAQFVRCESFKGGSWAVGAHAASCSDKVELIAGPVTVKRRFIERYPFQKLFEVYESDESEMVATGTVIESTVAVGVDANLVIVADFGHGLITPSIVELLSERAKRLAVNTQANAGNHGFNTISKYPRAEFVSISERELRLDARDQTTDVKVLACLAAQARRATLIVTRGEKGCFAVDARQHGYSVAEAPALTTHAVDRTGAGDAVFAVTACLNAVGMPLDLLTFVASVVGTQAVGIVGNARYIERASLRSALEGYLA